MAASSSPELLMVSEQTVMWAGWDGWGYKICYIAKNSSWQERGQAMQNIQK